MEIVLDKATWLRAKDETLLTSLMNRKDQHYIAGGNIEGDDAPLEVVFREAQADLGANALLDTIEYICSYEAISQSNEEGVLLIATSHIGERVRELTLRSKFSITEWLSMSDIRKVAAFDKLVYLDLFIQGLVV